MFKKNNDNTISLNGKIGSELSFATREAYNLLRSNISFSLTDVDGCKVIGLTSAYPQEGKSYTSINLAYVIASDNKKVLFLDGDFRKSTIADTLGLPETPGIVDWFADKSLEIINKEVLTENLDVVVAGSFPANPSEIIGSASMKEFIKNAKEVYDYIIVDLPPVCVVSDVLALSSELNGVAVIVRHGFSRLKNVKKAVSQLKFSGVKILGIIYNAYSHNSSGYYKKHYYKNYNGYNSYKKYEK